MCRFVCQKKYDNFNNCCFDKIHVALIRNFFKIQGNAMWKCICKFWNMDSQKESGD